ncbi:T9SS type A sorting domain-containing protein [Adhaeribacter pallidiroseus]|uniref:Secretion system C-terminal sorting domain-containing protein n=1 Tax=Adhaeribacter pallidiroseus TaxID=2072847 RepID=A0A369QKX6_9BACT|nr:T9SS type A sorting domain-containing protein [Adhaeribacter pallidiroseus]RDC63907.1 hypothetical protein AHMF7616_02516 [Adhaeribacter pallidiroseus]
MKKTYSFLSEPQTLAPGLNPKWRRLGAAFLFCFSLTQLAAAQSKIWDKTIGSNNSESLNAAIPTRDGGSLLAGTIRMGSYELTYKEEIIKVGADGSKIWSKGLDDPSFHVTAIQEVAEGGYLVGGNVYTQGKYDCRIIKLQEDGTQVWVKTFGRKYDDDLSAILQTQDGGFILGGSAIVGKDNYGYPVNDYWAVKLDASGNKVWDKTFGGSNDDKLESIQQTTDGGYILGGSSKSGVSGAKTQSSKGDYDYWILKLKADGTPAWDKTLGGDFTDELIAVKQSNDGSFILGGSSLSRKTGDKSAYITGTWLVKLNAAGNKVWDKTIPNDLGDGNHSGLRTIQATTDRGYLLGLTSSAEIGGIKSEANRGYADYWLIKLKADGTQLWDKTIGSLNGDNLIAAYQTKDGNYLLAGTSGSNIGFEKTENSHQAKYFAGYDDDYWLVKLDNNIRQNQTLSFAPLKTQPYTQQPLTLQAQAGSGLPVSYQVISGAATVKGNKLTLTGPGEVVIKARQTGNATYNAIEVAQSFVATLVSKQQDQSFGGSQSETLTALLATPDGGYLAGGMSDSEATGTKSQAGKGKYDYWVVKTDNTGKKVWDKAFGGNQSDRLTTMVATPDGGYLLGGTSTTGISGDKSQTGKGKEDYWLIKIDAKGTKQWDKSFGGPEKDSLATIITTPKGYLLGGTSASGVSGDKSQAGKGATDYWILEIDGNGNKLWDKTFGGSGSDHLAALLATPDGYLVGGSSASGISGDKGQAQRGSKDYWVLRIRKDGTKIWEKTYGGLKNNSASFGKGISLLQGLVATPDGGFLLAGTSNASKGGERSEGRQGASEEDDYETHYISDYWVVKIDGQGTKAWDNFYGSIEADYFYGGGFSTLSRVAALPEGGYLLGGSTDGSGGDISEAYQAGNNYWLVKINEQGKKIGDKIIGGTANDYLSALVPAPDGSYLLGGTSVSKIGLDKSTASEGGTNYWVVQVQANAESRPNEPGATAWDMRYGGSGRDNFTTLIKTTDGGYLSGGYTNSGISGDKGQRGQGKNDYWIVKSDKNGKKLWDKSFGGSQDDFLNQVISTQDGGYLLAGSSFSNNSGDKSQASRGGRDYWVVKIDALGNKQWDKRFGGSGNDELKQVLRLASGEYVLAGYSDSPVSGDKSQPSQGRNDYWLVKISAQGNKVWDKRYGGSANDNLASFTLTATNGFILGGTSSSGISGDKTQASWGEEDFWLIRVDAQGNKIWDKRYGGNYADVLTTVGMNREYSPQTNEDGDYYVGGYSSSQVSGDKKQANKGGSDYWFLQIKSNGNLVRENSYGFGGKDELQSVVQTKQGDYLLAGTLNVHSGAVADGPNGSEYWAVRINAVGTQQYGRTFGGSGPEELRAMVLTEDGGFVLGGKSDSGVSGDRTQLSQGSTDYWLIKVNPESSNPVAARVALQPETGSQVQAVQVQAYPNPFQQKATIRFTLPHMQAASLKVYDSQGREVATLFNGEVKANQPYEVEWKAYNQAAGLYILQLQTPTGKQQQKLLLIK